MPPQNSNHCLHKFHFVLNKLCSTCCAVSRLLDRVKLYLFHQIHKAIAINLSYPMPLLSMRYFQQIMKYTREGHYQIACKVYFDATHSGADDQDVHINHPNQYFDESQLFYSGKKEGRIQICNSGHTQCYEHTC